MPNGLWNCTTNSETDDNASSLHPGSLGTPRATFRGSAQDGQSTRAPKTSAPMTSCRPRPRPRP
jgi:hypothetical protein